MWTMIWTRNLYHWWFVSSAGGRQGLSSINMRGLDRCSIFLRQEGAAKLPWLFSIQNLCIWKASRATPARLRTHCDSYVREMEAPPFWMRWDIRWTCWSISRRTIGILLLISESRDHGSKRYSAQDLVERIGTSNTLVL